MNTSPAPNEAKGRFILVALVAIATVGALVFVGKKPPAPPAPGKIRVVTTFAPMYVFTKNVTGDLAEVKNILKPGIEVHDYAFTPEDVELISSASLVIYNGMGLDDWALQAIRASGNKDIREVNLSTAVDGSRSGVGNRGFPVERLVGNPHLWINPAYAISMVGRIRDQLMQADPRNREAYARNAEAYLGRLMALDGAIRTATRALVKPVYISEEPSLTYFSLEYDLEEAAVLSGQPDVSVTAKDLAKIMKLMRSRGINVVFKNLGSESATVLTLASDTGAQVYEFDVYENGPLEIDGYEKAMKKNIETLKSAFRKL